MSRSWRAAEKSRRRRGVSSLRPPRRGQGLGVAAIAALLVVLLDQVTKWIVMQSWAGLPRGGRYLRLELLYNSGVSFSFLRGNTTVILVLVVAIVVVLVIALALASPPTRLALGVILGGALGNLVDRVFRDGAVVDFIGVWRWPTFNVADIAIVVGALLLVLVIGFGARR